MRRLVALIAGLAMLALVNFGIYQREQLLTRGQIVLLELAPVDPRSLMQGDYMRLNFAVATEAFSFERRRGLKDGHVVVAVGANRVGRFRRLADGRPLAPGEIALRYRVRSGQPNFATNAFFFEEGSAAIYQDAAYGEFRVDESGEMILTGLRGRNLEALNAGS